MSPRKFDLIALIESLDCDYHYKNQLSGTSITVTTTTTKSMIFIVLLVGAVSALHEEPGLLQSALSNPAVFTKLFSEYAVEQDRHYLAQERRLRAGLFRQTLKEVGAVYHLNEPKHRNILIP